MQPLNGQILNFVKATIIICSAGDTVPVAQPKVTPGQTQLQLALHGNDVCLLAQWHVMHTLVWDGRGDTQT